MVSCTLYSYIISIFQIGRERARNRQTYRSAYPYPDHGYLIGLGQSEVDQVIVAHVEGSQPHVDVITGGSTQNYLLLISSSNK